MERAFGAGVCGGSLRFQFVHQRPDESTDQQQTRWLAGKSFGRAMKARWNRTAGIVHGDAPEIAQAEGKRPRLRGGGVVEVVAILIQILEKLSVIFPSEEPEEFGAGFGDVHAPLRLVVAQTLTGRPVIGAKISGSFHGGAVGVKGEDVGRDRPRILITRIAVDAVEDGVKAETLEQPLVFEEKLDGAPARRAHGKAVEQGIIEHDDPLADAEQFHHLTEITRQHARPAERVDAAAERSRDQFMETAHPLDAMVAGRRGERNHAPYKGDTAINSTKFQRQRREPGRQEWVGTM